MDDPIQVPNVSPGYDRDGSFDSPEARKRKKENAKQKKKNFVWTPSLDNEAEEGDRESDSEGGHLDVLL